MSTVVRVVVTAALCLLAAGCGTPDHVRLTVTPADALYDAPLTARVSGLNPQEHVELRLSLADPHSVRTRWTSHGTAEADAHGRVTLRLDRLIAAMRPSGDRQGLFVSPGRRAFPITVTVSDGGHRLAARTVRRESPQSAGDVTVTRFRPDHGGLFADLYQPTHATGRHSAVVVTGGSEGGIYTPDVQAALLAAHGHPALAVAYFKEPGLPEKLSRIPIEDFGRALRLLRTQPGVDPSRVFVWGGSYGTEAAALTALHYPRLVRGVIDASPSSVVTRSLGTNREHSAWTFAGREVPFAYVERDPEATSNPPALLRLADFPGRVLAICGARDAEWPSCPYSDVIKRGDPDRTTVLRYRGAGHYVDTVVPYLPSSAAMGGTPAADAGAHADMWPRILAFVDS